MTQNKDYSAGQTFFQWMTRSFLDKLYSYGCTSIMVAGIIFTNVYGANLWPIEDLGFAYGLSAFFALLGWIGTRNLWTALAIGSIMATLTFYLQWFGWVQGFCLFWIYIYWFGYYRIFKKLQKGISS